MYLDLARSKKTRENQVDNYTTCDWCIRHNN